MSVSTPVWDCHTHIYGPYDRYPLPKEAVYVPEAAPFDALRAVHKSIGITHGVIVQAANYGPNHCALLAALDAGNGAYRGIAVISPEIPDEKLAMMAARGVKGIRIGLMSHLGNSFDAGKVRALVERIRPYGWHALIHGEPENVMAAADAAGHYGVKLVIDHMARLSLDAPDLTARLDDICTLLRHEHVWIKVSGVDRITKGRLDAPEAKAVLQRLVETAPKRAIWGTDWPHPNLTYPVPKDDALLSWLGSAVGDEAMLKAVLSENPASLYQ